MAPLPRQVKICLEKSLFQGKKLDPCQIGHRFEAVIGCHQQTVGRVHGQFQSKCVGIGNLAVHFERGRTQRTVAVRRRDMRLKLRQACHGANLSRRAHLLAYCTRNLSPLNRGNRNFRLLRPLGGQDLGYPNGYFNDRLVEAIDSLLATPQLTGPIDLVRPNVMYEFADPALKARPAGQKLMIRLGPDNATEIKAKLTELRAALVAAAPH